MRLFKLNLGRVNPVILFGELNQQGMTIITVTHESMVAERAHRTIWLRDGLIVNGEN